MLSFPSSLHLLILLILLISLPGRLRRKGASKELLWLWQIPLLTKARWDEKQILDSGLAESIFPEFSKAHGSISSVRNSSIFPAIVIHSPRISIDSHELILLSSVSFISLSTDSSNLEMSDMLPDTLMFLASIFSEVIASFLPTVNPSSRTDPFSAVMISKCCCTFILPASDLFCTNISSTSILTAPQHSRWPLSWKSLLTVILTGCIDSPSCAIHFIRPVTLMEIASRIAHSISDSTNAIGHRRNTSALLRMPWILNLTSSIDSSMHIALKQTISLEPLNWRFRILALLSSFAERIDRVSAFMWSLTWMTEVLIAFSFCWNLTTSFPNCDCLFNWRWSAMLKRHAGWWFVSLLRTTVSSTSWPIDKEQLYEFLNLFYISAGI